jgi:hypothetical protein
LFAPSAAILVIPASLRRREINPPLAETERTRHVARKTIEMRFAELVAQTKAVKARMSKQERARDTRRKVLLGAYVLHRLDASKDEEFARRLGDWLRRDFLDFLTREVDKELFADLLKPPAGPAHNPIEAAPLPLELPLEVARS